jgi:hypothetical protein
VEEVVFMRDNPTVIVLAITAALLLWGMIWWFWWQMPKQVRRLDIHDAKARADVEDAFRKTIGQALGGAAVLIGAGAAYLQFMQQQQASREQLQAAHDLLISQQVAKGFEQLGSDRMVVRLGGIYALEGATNSSTQYHQPILEALCAYVRENTKTHVGEDAPVPDIQAALTVIVRRVRGNGGVNLAFAHIPKADLRANGFKGADFIGADLRGADLRGVHMSDDDLSWADIHGADLRGAHLSGVNLSNAKLVNADLTGAYLRGLGPPPSDGEPPSNRTPRLYDNTDDLSFGDAILSGADLTGATVTQAQLNGLCGTEAKLPAGLTLEPCPAH